MTLFQGDWAGAEDGDAQDAILDLYVARDVEGVDSLFEGFALRAVVSVHDSGHHVELDYV